MIKQILSIEQQVEKEYQKAKKYFKTKEGQQELKNFEKFEAWLNKNRR